VAVPIRNYVNMRALMGVGALMSAALFLAGCGSTAQTPANPKATTTAKSSGALFTTGDCAPVNLTTRDAGHLNVGYSRPQAPYFVDRAPGEPVGFEVAVVNAIARALGFESNQVLWIVDNEDPQRITAMVLEDMDYIQSEVGGTFALSPTPDSSRPPTAHD
jgi:ABC-type amino acid transport substrate-binding protein